MTLSTNFNETFTQTRITTSSYNTSDSVVTVSTFDGLFRNVTDKSKLYVESNFGKEADILCDEGENIEVGDTLTGETHGAVSVLGVSGYKDLEDDTDSHLDIRVVKK